MYRGLPDVTEDLRLLLDNKIFYDPWLSAILERDLDPAVDVALLDAVARLTGDFWSPMARADALGVLAIGDEFLDQALRETVLSTHCLRSIHEGTPREPDRDAIGREFAHLRSFAMDHGLGPILRSYLGVIGYENSLVLRHYNGISEADFVSGRRHRPWLERPIWNELYYMTGAGIVEIEIRDGQRYLTLTEFGRERSQQLRAQLQDAGYFQRRVQALYVSHFDATSESYDHLLDNLLPALMQMRRDFLDFAGVRTGDRVLEVGCGTGIFTIDCGLASTASPGAVLATDPSSDMMAVAMRKARARNLRNVDFALGRAEAPPYDGRPFDVFIGSLALHFTDAELTFKSAYEGLRPGGTLAMLWSLPLDFSEQSAMAWWFEPILRLIRQPEDSGFTARRFLSLKRASELLEGAGFTDVDVCGLPIHYEFWHVEESVRAILSLSLFQPEFEQLPWQARVDLIHDLVERGHQAVDRDRDALLVVSGMGMLRAHKPADAAWNDPTVRALTPTVQRLRPKSRG